MTASLLFARIFLSHNIKLIQAIHIKVRFCLQILHCIILLAFHGDTFPM